MYCFLLLSSASFGSTCVFFPFHPTDNESMRINLDTINVDYCVITSSITFTTHFRSGETAKNYSQDMVQFRRRGGAGGKCYVLINVHIRCFTSLCALRNWIVVRLFTGDNLIISCHALCQTGYLSCSVQSEGFYLLITWESDSIVSGGDQPRKMTCKP